MSDEEREKKKADFKLTKSQLLGVILVGLLALIAGAGVLLHHNFNIIGQFSCNAHDIYVSGSYAYITEGSYGLEIIDISDPTNPVEVGNFYDGSGSARGVYVSGSYAYVADGSDGLEIIDISDPTTPVEVGHFYDGNGSAYGVYVSGLYAYVADHGDGLEIIDISDPTNPVEVGQFDDGGYAWDVYVSGLYAYVAYETDGLEIIDISNPTDPTEVGQFDDGGYAYGVYVSGSYAYVADYLDGLEIIDISDPTNPVEVGQFDDGGYAWDVYVSGSYAYVADGYDGLEIIDPWSLKEKISNVIFWSIIGILILLTLVDLLYLIKEVKPLWKEKLKIISDEKKKIICFFIGFLMTYAAMLILTIISYLFSRNISYGDRNTIRIVYYSSLGLLGIIASMIGVCIRNKNPFISKGMITAIFGLAFLLIKTNGEQLVEPYTEQPKKKRTHFIIGFFLSFGLVILYALLIYIFFVLTDYALLPFHMLSIFVLNIFSGMRRFFFKEKLHYISKGMLPLILVGILVLGFYNILLAIFL